MPQNNTGQGVRISHCVSSLFFAWLGGGTTGIDDMQQRTFAMSRSARLVVGVAAVLALLPTVSQALGIGDLTLQSALSEPFRAEIELGSVSLKDLKTLKASLVRRPDFAIGAASQDALITRQLAVHIASEPDGRHLLKLYSEQAIREPYVHFLVQLDWAGGRLTREFMVLLDPRETAAESDVAAPEAQALPNTDTQTSAAAQTLPTAGTAAPEGAAEIAQTPAQAVPSADATAAKQIPVESVGSQAKESATVQATHEPTKSDRTTPVSATNEQLRLASEIRTWAQSRTRLQPDTEASEADTAESQRGAAIEPSAAATAAKISRKIAERAHANAPAPKQRQTTLLGWIGEHTQELLMGFVALLALLLVGAGTAWLMLTWKQQPSRGISPYPANQIPTELVEKRQRGGRRRQFVPVAIERRRSARRQADAAQPALAPIDASEAAVDMYADDSVERALKDAISKHPTRHGLKLKLLALYHTRDDKAAFESLLNNIYAAVESEPESGEEEENWPSFEDYDDLAASDDAAALRAGLNAPQLNMAVPDEAEAKAGEQSPDIVDYDAPEAKDEDAAAPTLRVLDVPEYPLLVNEHMSTEIDDGLLDLETAFASEDEPASIESLTVAPMEETDPSETANAGIDVLHIDDLADIRGIVEQGMDMIEGKDFDERSEPSARPRASRKGGKRKRKTKASAKSKEATAEGHTKGTQWRDPATKIDLAKAYIDMGDPERARHILDEVLAHWHRRQGSDR